MSITSREREVLARIESGDVVDFLVRLVAFPSVNPPGEESKIAGFVAQALEALGFRTVVQDVLPRRPNVTGILGNGGKRVVFNTHLDVVPATSWNHGDPFTARIEDGRIYGRGAADPKGSLAAMIVAAKAVVESSIELAGEVAITAVSDEEGASLGAKTLFTSFAGDYGVVGEPTSLRPMIAHRGSLRLVVASIGRAAHSALPEEGINAIYEMIPVLHAIQELHHRIARRSHHLCGSPTLTVTRIQGGVKENMIPDRCEITLDRRLLPGEESEEAVREIEDALDRTRRSGGPACELVRMIETTGGAAETPADEAIARLALRSVADIVGHEVSPGGLAVACDMVHLTKAGIPTVVLGPGDIALAHTADEHVGVQELVQAAKIYALLILRSVCR